MNTPKLKMQIPFEGFYNSLWDGEISAQLYYDAMRLVDADSRFEEVEISVMYGILQDLVKWKDARNTIAMEYARSYGRWLQSELGLPDAEFGWQFDSWVRSSEHNLETDRIFVSVSENVVRLIFEQTDKDNLRKVIHETLKERSRYTSFYSDNSELWLEPPVEDWDHNELGTLLRAWAQTKGDDVDDR